MIKYAIALAAILALVGGVYYAGHAAGFDQRDKTVQGEIDDAVQREREEAQERQDKAVAAAEGQVVVEEVIRTEIREVEVEIPVEIEKIVEVKPECADLPEFAGLLNKQVAAANSLRVPEHSSEPSD